MTEDDKIGLDKFETGRLRRAIAKASVRYTKDYQHKRNNVVKFHDTENAISQQPTANAEIGATGGSEGKDAAVLADGSSKEGCCIFTSVFHMYAAHNFDAKVPNANVRMMAAAGSK